MNTITCTVPILLVVTALAVPAAGQAQDAVPVRIATEAYGSPSGGSLGPNKLSVSLDTLEVDEATDPRLVVTGGPADGVAYVLLGRHRIALPGPFGTVLLTVPEVILPLGRLDAAGAARVPVDLVRRELAGTTACLQALSIGRPNNEVCMSAGLSLRVVAGNVQPKLSYNGPPNTAVLIARTSGAEQSHEILHCVSAPTTLWSLSEAGRATIEGVTRIYMRLEAPAANEVVMPVLDVRRCLIPLDSQAQLVIEVWIGMAQRGAAGPAVFELAARIERDF